MAFQRALKLDRQMSSSTMSTPRQMIPARDVVVMMIHRSVQRSFPSSFSSPSCIHQNRVMNAAMLIVNSTLYGYFKQIRVAPR